MENISAKSALSAALRQSRYEPVRAGAALALMLLWSQTPTPKLKGLPTFKDASAEFMLSDPKRVAQNLCPDLADEIARLCMEQTPRELEILRRSVMNALDAGLAIDHIADVILEVCSPDTWISTECSDTLLAALDAKKGTRARCAFSYVLRPAWTLSKQIIVELNVEDHESALILSVLATACSRSLTVRVVSISAVAEESDQEGDFDHALILPPIGMRHKLDHPLKFSDSSFGDQLSPEAFSAVWGAHLGRRRNIVVVGNGFLFRTSSKDAAFKRDLIHAHGLDAIVSLPRGTLPGSMVAMSALVFSGETPRRNHRDQMRFIDGTDPAALDAATLSQLLKGKCEHPLCVDASLKEVSETGFNLAVDRYVLDPATQRNRALLKDQEVVQLSDLADIRRPQALPRQCGKEGGFEVREALLADIDNNRLCLPGKLSELPHSAVTKVESATLKPGDILLSIKGTIGKVALVTKEAIAKSAPVPIVPGQSFVVIRLRKGGLIRDPQVLVSYLRSPLAQSLLHGMAGGTVISNVAMGELKNMAVPVLSMEAQAAILNKSTERQAIQEEIEELREKMKYIDGQIFSIALDGANGGTGNADL